MRETCAFWAKCGLVCLMILAGAGGMNSGRVAAQSSDPSGLPLLSEGGLEYVGGFRLPNYTSNGEGFSFGGYAVAFSPNSLFVSSYHGAVAEVSIPTPGNSSDFRALPPEVPGFAVHRGPPFRHFRWQREPRWPMVKGNRLMGRPRSTTMPATRSGLAFRGRCN